MVIELPDMRHNAMFAIDILLEGKNPATILELGSGWSSYHLASKGHKVYAVEHDPVWQNKFDNVNYICAPIVELPTNIPSYNKRFKKYNLWYDGNVIKEAIKDIKFDLYVIDGPPGYIGRSGLYIWRDLIDWSVPSLWDNTDRRTEAGLCGYISTFANHRFMLKVHNEMGWSFTVMSPKKKHYLELISKIADMPEKERDSVYR